MTSNSVPPNSSKSQLRRCFDYIIGDPHASDDPKEFSLRRKQMIILIISLSGFPGPLANMIYFPGSLSIAKEFNTTITTVNGTFSSYMIFMGLGPLFVSVFSDQYGRKRLFLLTTFIGFAASIICAFSTHIAMLIVFRALQAAGTCACMSLGPAVIADTIPIEQRGRAYGFFNVGPMLGPAIGPALGGAMCQYLGWRSTLYFIAILELVLFSLVAIFLPETLRKSDKKNTFVKSFKTMLQMLRDPICITITLYVTVNFACHFLIASSPKSVSTLTELIHDVYGLNEWLVGMVYLSLGVGIVLGSMASGILSDYALRALNTKSIPERRLRATLPSAIGIPLGCLLYGWCTQFGVALYAAVIGLVIYGFFQMVVPVPATIYLVDIHQKQSATAAGVLNCIRSWGSAVTSVLASDLMHAQGIGIFSTTISATSILNVGLAILCIIYGQRWRESRHPSDERQEEMDEIWKSEKEQQAF
ncbi:major facilitator superfamily domain-containing protein [Fennellomyces sp. T-0311]|nr:major facilitator superfamily domain-containing protein [Fennellomyces sp. T-0311]